MAVVFVALPIALKFGTPVPATGLRDMRVDTSGMLMPKAASDLDDALQTWEYHVGPAWQVHGMEPVTVTHAMNQPPHHQLWRRVLATNTPHVRGAAFWREIVQAPNSPDVRRASPPAPDTWRPATRAIPADRRRWRGGLGSRAYGATAGQASNSGLPRCTRSKPL